MKRNIYYLFVSFIFFIVLQTNLSASIFDHLNKQSDASIFKKKISKSEIDNYLYIYAPSSVKMGAVENFGYYIGYAKISKTRNFKGKIYFFGNLELNEKENEITNGELIAYLKQNVSSEAFINNRQQEPMLFGDPNKILIRY